MNNCEICGELVVNGEEGMLEHYTACEGEPEFTVRAIRTDSWLGIKVGEEYSASILRTASGEKIMVNTDGYHVLFNEKDFEVVEKI